MIKIREVNKNNYLDCIRLELFSDQDKNLASNAVSIAQSMFEEHYRTRAIYKGDKVVGFLAYCHENEPEDLELYWLFRFMIDKDFQGKGISTKALEILVDEVNSLGGKRLHTMHKPTNISASMAYKNFGFKEIGVLNDGDIHLEFEIK